METESIRSLKNHLRTPATESIHVESGEGRQMGFIVLEYICSKILSSVKP